jgi:hypothetical protein
VLPAEEPQRYIRRLVPQMLRQLVMQAIGGMGAVERDVRQ